MKYTATIGERSYEIEVESDGVVKVDGEPHAVDFRAIEGSVLYSLLVDNHSYEALIERPGADQFCITIGDEQHLVSVEDERTRRIGKGMGRAQAATGEVVIKAPMPGLVRGVPVEVWEEVKVGQGVVILEAMKMENELRTPRAGIVNEIRVKSGDKVEQGQVLVVIK